MRIISENATIIYKILPLTFNVDGSVHITVSKCIQHENGDIFAISGDTIVLSPEQVSEVLDISPTPGLTRRQDIGLLVYQLLLTSGVVTGTLDPEQG